MQFLLERILEALREHQALLKAHDNFDQASETLAAFDSCITETELLLAKLQRLETDHYNSYLSPATDQGKSDPPTEVSSPATARSALQHSQALSNSHRTEATIFRDPVIEVLKQCGGSCSFETIVRELDRQMKGVLTEEDCLPVSFNSALRRWHLTLIFLRQILIAEGVITWEKERDTWGLKGGASVKVGEPKQPRH